MARKLKWTARASDELYRIVSYWEENWSERAFAKVTRQTFKILDLLTEFPEMGRIEKFDVRVFVIEKRLKVFYRINAEEIILLSFFDTRSNPTA